MAVDLASLHSLEGKTQDDLCGDITFQVNIEVENDVRLRKWRSKTMKVEKSRLGWTAKKMRGLSALLRSSYSFRIIMWELWWEVWSWCCMRVMGGLQWKDFSSAKNRLSKLFMPTKYELFSVCYIVRPITYKVKCANINEVVS